MAYLSVVKQRLPLHLACDTNNGVDVLYVLLEQSISDQVNAEVWRILNLASCFLHVCTGHQRNETNPYGN